MMGLAAGVNRQSIAPYLENMQRMRDANDMQKLQFALQSKPSNIYNNPNLKATWEKVSGNKISDQPQYLTTVGSLLEGQKPSTAVTTVESPGYQEFKQSLPYEYQPANDSLIQSLGLPPGTEMTFGQAVMLAGNIRKQQEIQSLINARRIDTANQTARTNAYVNRTNQAAGAKEKITLPQAINDLRATAAQAAREYATMNPIKQDPNALKQYVQKKLQDKVVAYGSMFSPTEQAVLQKLANMPTNTANPASISAPASNPQIPTDAGNTGSNATANVPVQQNGILSPSQQNARKSIFGQ